RAFLERHPSQSRLLSRATLCSMSAFMASTSGLIAISSDTGVKGRARASGAPKRGVTRASVEVAQVLGRLLFGRRRSHGRRRDRRRSLGPGFLLTTDDVVIILRPLRLDRARRFFAQLAFGARTEGFLNAVHGAEDGVLRLHERPRRALLQGVFHEVD